MSRLRKATVFKITIGVLVISAIISINLWAEGKAEKEAKKVKTFKIHHVMNTQHYYHTGAEKFKELVENNSGGTIKVEIYPNGQLGSDKEVLELLQSGDVAFATGIPSSKLSSFVPEMNALDLPYLWKTQEEMKEWTKSESARKMLEVVEDYGFKGLGYCVVNMRYPLSKKGPLEKPEDFKGLKIRVMGTPVAIDAYKALGASPIPMPFGEVYTAMQTGVVDACENSIATLWSQRFYEVAEYVSMVPVLPFVGFNLMSKEIWDSLTTEQQKAIEDTMPETFRTTQEASDSQDMKGLKEMKEAGIKVNEPQNPKAFTERERKVWQKYVPELPSFAQDVVKQILGDRY